MAGSLKRGGDRVLESRHLVSLFLGVVLLCGVFFTLGYVMGHNQYGGPVHAADSSENGDQPVRPVAEAERTRSLRLPPAPAPANNEWDFYAKNNADNTVNSMSKPSAACTMPSPAAAPRRPRIPSRQRPPTTAQDGSDVGPLPAAEDAQGFRRASDRGCYA